MVVEKEKITHPSRHIIFTIKEILLVGFLNCFIANFYFQGRRLLEADLTT